MMVNGLTRRDSPMTREFRVFDPTPKLMDARAACDLASLVENNLHTFRSPLRIALPDERGMHLEIMLAWQLLQFCQLKRVMERRS